jgi:NodT family efflux transporter outer membrane factor (OMF) lipoprotein
MEHAIAILIGVEPANFTLPPRALAGTPPLVAGLLPSELLERRPDIAAAERRMAAANADIGVARAAYFPVFDLAALGGLEAAKTGNLLKSAAPLWAFGATASGPLFDAGLRDANVDLARAAFEENSAIYRQTVLNAYREVEDALAGLRRLAAEAASQETAVAAANRSLMQAQTRYKGGVATYLDVISAQTTALLAEQTAIDIRTRRMVTAVNLVQALGGGWHTGDQPTTSANR